MPAPRYGAVDAAVGLARTLAAAGVSAGPDRTETFVRALAALDPADRAQTYWAGRLALCAGPDDVARYDVVFAAYFGQRPPLILRRRQAPPATLQALVGAPTAEDGSAPETEAAQRASAAASSTEQLRQRDVSSLTDAEREQVRRLLAALSLPGEVRRSRRHRPALRGGVDPRRTTREWLRAGGEPARLHHRRRTWRPRKVVLLVDVSGSMDRYADALLRFAHAASRRGGTPTEVFALGTRLTRLTRELSHRDPDTAMAAVARALPDAGGGTRLGTLVKEFADRWGQRGLARGAIVVIMSDGWERGDPALLGEQVARLRRLAHRLIWSNPLKATPGYAPLAGGMAAALPHVDNFVAGHSVAALERLAAVVLGQPGKDV